MAHLSLSALLFMFVLLSPNSSQLSTTWTELSATLPHAVKWPIGGYCDATQKIWIFGGWVSDGYVKSVLSFDPNIPSAVVQHSDSLVDFPRYNRGGISDGIFYFNSPLSPYISRFLTATVAFDYQFARHPKNYTDFAILPWAIDTDRVLFVLGGAGDVKEMHVLDIASSTWYQAVNYGAIDNSWVLPLILDARIYRVTPSEIEYMDITGSIQDIISRTWQISAIPAGHDFEHRYNQVTAFYNKYSHNYELWTWGGYGFGGPLNGVRIVNTTTFEVEDISTPDGIAFADALDVYVANKDLWYVIGGHWGIDKDTVYSVEYSAPYEPSVAPTPSPTLGCSVTYPGYLGDGFCDLDGGYNTALCDYDHGDCCESTCVSATYTCGTSTYVCLDPSAPVPTQQPSQSPIPASFTCTTRIGISATNGTTSTVSCDASETMVSCGVFGSEITGSRQANGVCEATDMYYSPPYPVTARARCCTFPSSANAVATTVVVQSGSIGSTASVSCPPETVLTGCSTDWVSGMYKHNEGSWIGSTTPPSGSGWAWTSAGNQCNGRALSGTTVQVIATCISLDSWYGLSCGSAAAYTNYDGFGTCRDGLTMTSCEGFSPGTGGLDFYFADGNDGPCNIGRDDHALHFAIGVCCEFNELTSYPTTNPSRNPTTSISTIAPSRPPVPTSFTCTTRFGNSAANGAISTVSCDTSETMVSCGAKGGSISGSRQANGVCEAQDHAWDTNWPVTSRARCCAFPSSANAVATTAVVESGSTGSTASVSCPSETVLTGCSTHLVSGHPDHNEGSWVGSTLPSGSGWTWTDAENQCNGRAYSGTIIQVIATCISFNSWGLSCESAAVYTNGNGFGTCQGGLMMTSCEGFAPGWAALDSYYVSDYYDAAGTCDIQRNDWADHFAIGICCEFSDATSNPTITSMNPTRLPSSDPTTNRPTSNPSSTPTSAPTPKPTTSAPTLNPTVTPTIITTSDPSVHPTLVPLETTGENVITTSESSSADTRAKESDSVFASMLPFISAVTSAVLTVLLIFFIRKCFVTWNKKRTEQEMASVLKVKSVSEIQFDANATEVVVKKIDNTDIKKQSNAEYEAPVVSPEDSMNDEEKSTDSLYIIENHDHKETPNTKNNAALVEDEPALADGNVMNNDNNHVEMAYTREGQEGEYSDGSNDERYDDMYVKQQNKTHNDNDSDSIDVRYDDMCAKKQNKTHDDNDSDSIDVRYDDMNAKQIK
eukprot:557729_1